MIKAYISELEIRLEVLKSLIGQSAETCEAQIKAVKQTLSEIISKLASSKDIQRKYQKLSNFVEKHCDLIDGMITADKINIVLDQLEELKERSKTLNKLEKLLPALNTEEYVKLRSCYENIDVLSTTSSVKLNSNSNSIEIIQYSDMSLRKIQEEQRQEMNAIAQLNYRMLNNLNEKLKLACQRRGKK